MVRGCGAGVVATVVAVSATVWATAPTATPSSPRRPNLGGQLKGSWYVSGAGTWNGTAPGDGVEGGPWTPSGLFTADRARPDRGLVMAGGWWVPAACGAGAWTTCTPAFTGGVWVARSAVGRQWRQVGSHPALARMAAAPFTVLLPSSPSPSPTPTNGAASPAPQFHCLLGGVSWGDGGGLVVRDDVVCASAADAGVWVPIPSAKLPVGLYDATAEWHAGHVVVGGGYRQVGNLFDNGTAPEGGHAPEVVTALRSTARVVGAGVGGAVDACVAWWRSQLPVGDNGTSTPSLVPLMECVLGGGWADVSSTWPFITAMRNMVVTSSMLAATRHDCGVAWNVSQGGCTAAAMPRTLLVGAGRSYDATTRSYTLDGTLWMVDDVTNASSWREANSLPPLIAATEGGGTYPVPMAPPAYFHRVVESHTHEPPTMLDLPAQQVCPGLWVSLWYWGYTAVHVGGRRELIPGVTWNVVPLGGPATTSYVPVKAANVANASTPSAIAWAWDDQLRPALVYAVGQVVDVVYARTCANCAPDMYIASSCTVTPYDVSCAPCTQCGVGQYATSSCTGSGRTDRGCSWCAPCPPGAVPISNCTQHSPVAACAMRPVFDVSMASGRTGLLVTVVGGAVSTMLLAAVACITACFCRGPQCHAHGHEGSGKGIARRGLPAGVGEHLMQVVVACLLACACCHRPCCTHSPRGHGNGAASDDVGRDSRGGSDAACDDLPVPSSSTPPSSVTATTPTASHGELASHGSAITSFTTASRDDGHSMAGSALASGSVASGSRSVEMVALSRRPMPRTALRGGAPVVLPSAVQRAPWPETVGSVVEGDGGGGVPAAGEGIRLAGGHGRRNVLRTGYTAASEAGILSTAMSGDAHITGESSAVVTEEEAEGEVMLCGRVRVVTVGDGDDGQSSPSLQVDSDAPDGGMEARHAGGVVETPTASRAFAPPTTSSHDDARLAATSELPTHHGGHGVRAGAPVVLVSPHGVSNRHLVVNAMMQGGRGHATTFTMPSRPPVLHPAASHTASLEHDHTAHAAAHDAAPRVLMTAMNPFFGGGGRPPSTVATTTQHAVTPAPVDRAEHVAAVGDVPAPSTSACPPSPSPSPSMSSDATTTPLHPWSVAATMLSVAVANAGALGKAMALTWSVYVATRTPAACYAGGDAWVQVAWVVGVVAWQVAVQVGVTVSAVMKQRAMAGRCGWASSSRSPWRAVGVLLLSVVVGPQWLLVPYLGLLSPPHARLHPGAAFTRHVRSLLVAHAVLVHVASAAVWLWVAIRLPVAGATLPWTYPPATVCTVDTFAYPNPLAAACVMYLVAAADVVGMVWQLWQARAWVKGL